MKINGFIEVNGIERVVFYKKNVFTRLTSESGQVYWYDSIRGKTLGDHTMCEIIKNATHNLGRKVWVHGNSINVERVGKKRMKELRVLAKYLESRAAEVQIPLS